jgi:hypothetical protein
MPLMVIRAATSYDRPRRKARQGQQPQVQETAPRPALNQRTGSADHQDCDFGATDASQHQAAATSRAYLRRYRKATLSGSSLVPVAITTHGSMSLDTKPA